MKSQSYKPEIAFDRLRELIFQLNEPVELDDKLRAEIQNVIQVLICLQTREYYASLKGRPIDIVGKMQAALVYKLVKDYGATKEDALSTAAPFVRGSARGALSRRYSAMLKRGEFASFEFDEDIIAEAASRLHPSTLKRK